MKIIITTSLALIAFAANSVLCRLALHDGLMDAGSFTVVRLFSGALVLWLILGTQKKRVSKGSGSWLASFLLFLYAVTFSYAYISLDIGTGALILFGAGQITLIAYAVWEGKRINRFEGLGLGFALFGFVYLMFPSASAPSWLGFVLMSISGIAWAFYTVIGKGSKFPLADTTCNFIRSIPMLFVLLALSFQDMHVSTQGLLYAILSGAIASGIGYTIWYMAVVHLQTIHAAVVQLLVPVLAAFAGVVLMAEPITTQLFISSAMILGGILVVTLQRNKV